jgi:prevent-host-death family protein
MKLGLREANQQFSKAIKAVRAGTEVVLTDRGRAIAVIKPIREKNAARDIAFQLMVDEGLVKPASRRGVTPTPRWHPAKIKGASLAKTVIDDRDDRA